jgi:hypothetical protein
MRRLTWRTREDPFVEEDRLAVAQQLAEAPELEAKVLFEDLVARRPERGQHGGIGLEEEPRATLLGPS